MLVALLAATIGCSGREVQSLRWRIEGGAGVSDRARVVIAEVRPGDCRDPMPREAVHRVRLTLTGTVVDVSAPPLAPGRWSFTARARDTSCVWFADGCTAIDLPAARDAEVVTQLVATASETPACAAEMCVQGVCADELRDAGTDASIDAGPIDAGPPCPGASSCEGDVLSRCEGSTRIVETCALGCVPGELRCAQLVPSNVSATVFVAGANDVTVAAGTDMLFDTDACSWLGSMHVAVVTLADGSEACVLSARDVTIQAGARLRFVGSRPVIVAIAGAAQIDGVIDVSAVGVTPGAGGFLGGFVTGFATSYDGQGPSGGSRGPAPLENGHAAGGGGGGMCGGGGHGGAGAFTPGGAGGGALPITELVPLHGGSGGGYGRRALSTSATDPAMSAGGAGGGALQITALVAIRVNGQILAGGGGGRGGQQVEVGYDGSGGGGGSGGAILLEAPIVELGPASLLNAAGGGGGSAPGLDTAGVDGQDGRDTLDRAAGGPGLFGGAAGGSGGGASLVDGDPGAASVDPKDEGGGGGGGAGCILIRNATGAMPSGGVITPSAAPGVRALPVARQ